MKNVLVTGATGFLGGALAHRLKADGVAVTVLGRNAEKGKALEAQGMRFVAADLADRSAIVKACENQDVVFHSGALSSPWGKYDDFHRANVLGTQHIIEGCLTHQVKRLVHVSTPSLYFSHGNRLNVKETDSLADPFVNFYTSTKRQAELLLIEAHKAQGLPFVALRPRAIYGEGDNAIFPRLIEALKAGRLPVIGKGDNVVDMSYVENVVDALLLSAQADDHVLGQFYNITNGEPTRLWDTIFLICDQLGLERPSRHVSFKTLFRIAGVLEWTHRHLLGGKEPMLTQYGVGVLGNSQTLSIEAAKHDLGYEPRFSTKQGIERFLKWYQENG